MKPMMLAIVCVMVAGCSPESKLGGVYMEHESRLRVTPTGADTFAMTIRKNFDPLTPNVDKADVRLRLARTALNCPSAQVLSERRVDRGLGLRDYHMSVKC